MKRHFAAVMDCWTFAAEPGKLFRGCLPMPLLLRPAAWKVSLTIGNTWKKEPCRSMPDLPSKVSKDEPLGALHCNPACFVVSRTKEPDRIWAESDALSCCLWRAEGTVEHLDIIRLRMSIAGRMNPEWIRSQGANRDRAATTNLGLSTAEKEARD
jgi:hypothetical protein